MRAANQGYQLISPTPSPHPAQIIQDGHVIFNIKYTVPSVISSNVMESFSIKHYISLRLRQLYKFKSLIFFFHIIFIFFRFFSTQAFPVMINGCFCLT